MYDLPQFGGEIKYEMISIIIEPMMLIINDYDIGFNIIIISKERLIKYPENIPPIILDNKIYTKLILGRVFIQS